MRICQRSWIVLVMTLFCGCLPMAGTRPPEFSAERKQDDPCTRFTFNACSTQSGDNLHTRAFAAMLLALEDGDWTVNEMNYRQKFISATACLANNPVNCATLNFQADLSGRISAHYKNEYTSRNLRDDVSRWMVKLKQVYSKYRCYSDELLSEAIVRFGFDPIKSGE